MSLDKLEFTINKVDLLHIIAYLANQNKQKESDELFSLYLKSLSNEKLNIEYENEIVIRDKPISSFLNDFKYKLKNNHQIEEIVFE
jgi:hypothetical protein